MSDDKKRHERIWLQDDEPRTWCQHQINDDDVEYVRADLALRSAVAPRIESSREDVQAALKYLHDSTAPDGQWADQAVHGFVGAMLKTLPSPERLTEPDREPEDEAPEEPADPLPSNEGTTVPHRLAPLCEEHGSGPGARSGCPYCYMQKLSAALSQIDYLCGPPNDMAVSGYDVSYNEDAVVENVKRALSARSSEPLSTAPVGERPLTGMAATLAELTADKPAHILMRHCHMAAQEIDRLNCRMAEQAETFTTMIDELQARSATAPREPALQSKWCPNTLTICQRDCRGEWCERIGKRVPLDSTARDK